MPCYTPLKAARTPGGGVKVVKSTAFIDKPLELACGQCIGCRIQKSKDWAIRCVHENETSSTSAFITLTYDRQHLPPDGGLRLEDWQRFARKLRKARGPFRYFHCGEYGDLARRPHYHACIFGLDWNHDRILYKRQPGGNLYRSPSLEKLWGKGFTTVGTVTYESAAYVARYVLKKVNGNPAEDHYTTIDPNTGEIHKIAPEYATMSRRPGIGSEWIKKYSSDVYPSDQVVLNARKLRPPRFYDQTLPEHELEELKLKRFERVKERKHELTPKRLAVRKKLTELKTTQQKRPL